MNQHDLKNYRFYRTDPTPWIGFEPPHVTSGYHAFIWMAIALATVIAVVVML
jgi:hypothetical protein